MNRKQLEILLSRSVEGFTNPKIEYEQYQTPPRVAANLLHFAKEHKHIHDKTVIDIGAGTGILGIGAAILGANVTVIEIDLDAIKIMRDNIENIDINLDIEIINTDIFKFEMDGKFDTVLLNPPFGIQQNNFRDLDFLQKAQKLGKIVYSIHDGSQANVQKIPELVKTLGLDPLGYYLDEFELPKSYSWHSEKQKINKVMVLQSKSLD